MVVQRGDHGTFTRGELVLWAVFLVVGCYLLVMGVIPATQAERAQAIELQHLERETQKLTRDLNLLNLMEGGLRKDPGLVEQQLRDRGYTPEGATRVVADPDTGR